MQANLSGVASRNAYTKRDEKEFEKKKRTHAEFDDIFFNGIAQNASKCKFNSFHMRKRDGELERGLDLKRNDKNLLEVTKLKAAIHPSLGSHLTRTNAFH